MEDLRFSLDYHFSNKSWYKYYELIRLDNNDYILKVVVSPNFSFKHIVDLMFKLNYNMENTLYWEQVPAKKWICVKFRIWRDNPDDNWL